MRTLTSYLLAIACLFGLTLTSEIRAAEGETPSTKSVSIYEGPVVSSSRLYINAQGYLKAAAACAGNLVCLKNKLGEEYFASLRVDAATKLQSDEDKLVLSVKLATPNYCGRLEVRKVTFVREDDTQVVAFDASKASDKNNTVLLKGSEVVYKLDGANLTTANLKYIDIEAHTLDAIFGCSCGRTSLLVPVGSRPFGCRQRLSVSALLL